MIFLRIRAFLCTKLSFLVETVLCPSNAAEVTNFIPTNVCQFHSGTSKTIFGQTGQNRSFVAVFSCLDNFELFLTTMSSLGTLNHSWKLWARKGYFGHVRSYWAIRVFFGSLAKDAILLPGWRFLILCMSVREGIQKNKRF